MATNATGFYCGIASKGLSCSNASSEVLELEISFERSAQPGLSREHAWSPGLLHPAGEQTFGRSSSRGHTAWMATAKVNSMAAE
jgi:hypothetical protein